MNYKELIIIESIRPRLNKNELRLFSYKLMNYESTQIMHELNITKTTYWKRCQRLREKIKDLI